MHELSIAQAIVQIAAAHAGDRRVASVHVRVGHLRQVVPAALAFAFELTAAATVVKGAELQLEEVPTTVRCRPCGEERALAGFPLACPACGSAAVDVVAGEELVVDSLELEHELTRSG